MTYAQSLPIAEQARGETARAIRAVPRHALSMPTLVEVSSLSPGRSLRETPLDLDHVERLIATGGDWPPLLARRDDRVVVDGMHRLAAAVELGLVSTAVVLLDGTSEDAFVEAVRANVAHGLPLTLSERKNASLHLLVDRPEWSDRMIARICGVSASTVRQLRLGARDGGGPGDMDQFARRVGRDGRSRPTNPAQLRRQIAQALDDQPDAPLRAIAARTGASPATVRAVRQAMGLHRVLPGLSGQTCTPVERPESTGPTGERDPSNQKSWATDSACASSEGPAQFALWFDRTRIDSSLCSLHLGNVPLSRVYEVADESLRRAKLWSDFAAALQARPATSPED